MLIRRAPALLQSLMTCALLSGLVACGNQAVTTPPQVQLDASAMSLHITPPEAAPSASLAYSMNDQAQRIASFDSSGVALIEGACPGENTISYQLTAAGQTSPKVSQKLQYAVPAPFGFDLPPTSSLAVGDSLGLRFVLKPVGQFGCQPTAEAQASGVAAITSPVVSQENGQYIVTVPVSSAKAGEGEISLVIHLGNATQTLSFPVHVVPAGTVASVTAVQLNRDAAASMLVGDALTLKPTVEGVGAFNTAVSYSSDHGDIATVDPSGVVTAKAPGKANITVQSVADTSKTTTLAVLVQRPDLQLQATPSAQTVGQGQSGQFQLQLSSKAGYLGSAKLQVTAPQGLTVTPSASSVDTNGSVGIQVQAAASTMPGQYSVAVSATDAKGVAQDASLTLGVTVTAPSTPSPTPNPTPTPTPGPGDTVPPILGVPTFPSDGLVTGQQTVHVSASDDVAVRTVALLVDGQSGGAFTALGGGQYQLVWNPGSLRAGIHTVQVRATDTSGNATSWSGTVDYRPPVSFARFLHKLNMGVGIPSSNMVFDSSGSALFVGMGYQLLRFDLSNFSSTQVSYADGAVQSLSFDPSSNLIWVVTGSGMVRAIRPSDLSTQVSPFASGGTPTTSAVPFSGGFFIGTDRGLVRVSSGGAAKLSSQKVLGLAGNGSQVAVSDSGSVSTYDLNGVLLKKNSFTKATWLSAGTNSFYSGWSMGYGGSLFDIQNLNAVDLAFPKTLMGSLSFVGDMNGSQWFSDRAGEIGFMNGNVLKLNSSIDYPALVDSGSIYASTLNGSLYKLNAAGTNLSQDGQVDGLGQPFSKVLRGPDGNLYYPSMSGYIYIIATN